MAFVIWSIYICFVISSFIIPPTIDLGPSMAFVYTFSVLQMVEVVVFVRVETLQIFFRMYIAVVLSCASNFQCIGRYANRRKIH